MNDFERTGAKYINIRIQRNTHQKLVELAGADLLPEQYLENVIDQITKGIPVESLQKTSSLIQTQLTLIMEKIAALDDRLKQLNEIALEYQRAIKNSQATSSLIPSHAVESFNLGIKKPEKTGEPYVHGWENKHYSPQLPDYSIYPVSVPAKFYDEDEGEDDDDGILEAKIRKYEEENPW